MRNAAEMTGEEKLKFVEDQIRQVRAHELDWMLCPYCGGENRPANELLCCGTFKEASEAVLTRMDQQDAVDFMSNVADKAMSAATKRFVN